MHETLQKLIGVSERIVFFGGAGVSTGSGIPDFRSAKGLYAARYQGLTPEMILSKSFFYLHPDIFFAFYKEYMLFPDAEPNAAHKALFAMERAGRLRGIVTQNIDGLHRKAGNHCVYELHGSVHENRCMDCGENYSLLFMVKSSGIPRCPVCGGIVKPSVVLYGESPDRFVVMGASREIGNADLLIIAGTSLLVEPAASLLSNFRGRHKVVINRTPIPAEEDATLVIRDSVESVLEGMNIPPVSEELRNRNALRVHRYRP